MAFSRPAANGGAGEDGFLIDFSDENKVLMQQYYIWEQFIDKEG